MCTSAVVSSRAATGQAIGRTPSEGWHEWEGSRFADGDTHPTPGSPAVLTNTSLGFVFEPPVVVEPPEVLADWLSLTPLSTRAGFRSIPRIDVRGCAGAGWKWVHRPMR